MITRYAAWIDGQGLQDIDPTLFITDIVEEEPDAPVEAVAHAGYSGSRVISRERRSLSVTIRFLIREYDVMRRRSILQKVRDWAHDGWLTTNEHQDQRLRVMCTKLPVISSALKWTEELGLTLTAYEQPYWQEQYAVVASATGTEGEISLRPMGTVPCRMEIDVKAGASPIGDVTIRVGEQAISFSSLGLKANETMQISYNDQGIMMAQIGNDGVLSKRTPTSADDLWLAPNADNRISFSANNPVTVTVKARGLWR